MFKQGGVNNSRYVQNIQNECSGWFVQVEKRRLGNVYKNATTTTITTTTIITIIAIIITKETRGHTTMFLQCVQLELTKIILCR